MDDKLFDEYGIIKLPEDFKSWRENGRLDWCIYNTKKDAENKILELLDKKKTMKLEAEKEEKEGYPGGNEKTYYYHREWKDKIYKIVKREVTNWEIVE